MEYKATTQSLQRTMNQIEEWYRIEQDKPRCEAHNKKKGDDQDSTQDKNHGFGFPMYPRSANSQERQKSCKAHNDEYQSPDYYVSRWREKNWICDLRDIMIYVLYSENANIRQEASKSC